MMRSTISRSTLPTHEVDSLEMLDIDEACSMLPSLHRMLAIEQCS